MRNTKRISSINFARGLTLCIILGFLASLPAGIIHADPPGSTPPVTITLLQNEPDHLIINYTLHDATLSPIPINTDIYYAPRLGDESNSQEPGSPGLPTICRSIIIPDQALMTSTVTASTYQDHKNILIAPARDDFSHNTNPDDMPYLLGPQYGIDDWYPGTLVQLHDPYILRDFRGQVIQVNPFQYNPITRTLREYTSLTIEITPQGTGGQNTLDREGPIALSSDFSSIYERHFLNYREPGSGGKGSTLYNPVEEIGNMIIICPDSFYSTIQPFAAWKNMKGVPTEIINLSSITGGTANDIKTYIQNYYNSHGLTFVLLVGDIEQIPTLTSYGSASDPSYSYILGTDHYPDLFVGRFSAQNTAQLETQVNRSIAYERYPLNGGTWYHNATGIASSQGNGIGDDGEADYVHMRNIRADLLNYTYTHVDELYDGSQGGEDEPNNPTATMVSTAINDGRSIINYCGHGSYMSWSTSGFNSNNINSLINDNMLPYVVCVACNNGQFDDYSSCFAETWMRATHNGEPTGAIGVYASTQSQSWAPPMDAQDEIIDILIETYPGNIKHTLGGLSYHGAMHMIDEYGSSAYDEIDTWTLFGDPSLQIRTDTPTPLTVSHGSLINNGDTHFNVTVTGVEGALCALSQNGVYLGANYTDSSGTAVISMDPPTGPIPVDLVVTAFNTLPYNATILLEDTLPPVITNITHVPLDPLMGDTVNVTCTITDASTVDTVVISLLDPDNVSQEVSMIHVPGTHTYYYNTTYQLPGDYHLTIWANDSVGNAMSAPLYVLTVHLVHSYTLYAGWNMLTVPVDTDYTAKSLGQQVMGCTVICKFDAPTESYISHVVGVPYNDFPIEPGVGYFLYIPAGTTATVTGVLLDSIDLSIYTGWNMIGWFQGDTTDAATLGAAIENTTVVVKFDAQAQTYTTYIVGTLHKSFAITRGMGLFIYTTMNSTWNGHG